MFKFNLGGSEQQLLTTEAAKSQKTLQAWQRSITSQETAKGFQAISNAFENLKLFMKVLSVLKHN